MAFDTSTNTSLLTTYLIKKFIPTLENELQYQRFAMRAELPEGMGNVARWNLFGNPNASTSSLTEGTTTANTTNVSTTGYEATIAEYGEFITETRLQRLAQVQGAREELVKRMAYGAALSIDTLLRDGPGGSNGIIDTTVDFYCTTAVNGGSADAATPAAGSASAIIGAAKLLRDNGVQGFTGVAGHPEGCFAAVVTPKFELDMVTEDPSTNTRFTWSQGVTNVPGVDGQARWVKGYMGTVYGTCLYRTQNTTATTVTNTADNNFVFGEGGFGSLHLEDADPQIFINTPSSGDVGNPYRNHSTIAWHTYFSCRLLDTNRVVRVYSAAT